MNLTENLQNLMRNNPRGSEFEHKEALWQRTQTSPDLRSELFEYWWNNRSRWTKVVVPSANEVQIKQERQSGRQSSATLIKKMAPKIGEQIAARILMDQVLSTGKLLRNSTFAEVKREGGWYIMLAKNGKPSEVVGKTLTEKNLRDIRVRAFK